MFLFWGCDFDWFAHQIRHENVIERCTRVCARIWELVIICTCTYMGVGDCLQVQRHLYTHGYMHIYKKKIVTHLYSTRHMPQKKTLHVQRYAFESINLYIYMPAYMYTRIHTFMYVNTYVNIYVHICIYIYVCIHVHTCRMQNCNFMPEYTYAHVRTCTYIYIYICTYA